MELNYASLGRRISGGVIDSILLIIFFMIYVRVFGHHVSPNSYRVEGEPALTLFIIIFLYFIVLEAVFGKTIGKMVVNTRVVTKDGYKISLGQSIIRNIMRMIDWLFLYLVAVIAIATSKSNQRLGDMLAKTVVIK